MMRSLAGGGIDVQLRALSPEAQDPRATQQAAAAGVASGGGPMPFGDRIQASFGRHDVSGIRAHTGAAAAQASRDMGAQAYVTGDSVAFGGAPDLHTAAHEAAHVIQQKQGVSLSQGVGKSGDAYERQADAVADRVVQGRSAEDLLGPKKSGGAASAAVQKKAYLGPSHAPAQKGGDEKVNGLIDDKTVRRFDDQAQLNKFAKGQKSGAGDVGGTWVNLGKKMVVLGENHGTPKAPDIIQGTGIGNFRYEGYSHHSATRKKADTKFTETLAAQEAKRDKKLKIEGTPAAAVDHSAEHALPKYTRAIPDSKAMALKQLREVEAKKAPDEKGADQKRPERKLPEQKLLKEIHDDVTPGRDLGEDYSLQKALMETLLTAFVYAKSYRGKFWGHTLKAFYNDNTEACEAWIAELQKSFTASKVPNYEDLDVGLLDTMHTAYLAAARAKVGLSSEKSVADFKAKLDLKNESDVAHTPESKEDDYLRDKSMLDMISKHKGSTRLFVIGDAHREKLHNLIVGLGLPVMKDTEFLATQVQANQDADQGITVGDRSGAEAVRARAASFKATPEPKKPNDRFTVPTDGLGECVWEPGAEVQTIDAKAGAYRVKGAGERKIELTWSKKGQKETIKSLKFTVKTDDRREREREHNRRENAQARRDQERKQQPRQPDVAQPTAIELASTGGERKDTTPI